MRRLRRSRYCRYSGLRRNSEKSNKYGGSGSIPVHGPSFYSTVVFVALHDGVYTAHQQLPIETVVVVSCLTKSMGNYPRFYMMLTHNIYAFHSMFTGKYRMPMTISRRRK
jgi:hypothetical protein